jgi:CRP-like cAMP-binding protein
MIEQALLAGMPFFDGLPERALTTVAEVATKEFVPAGSVLLRQGDQVRSVHFLVSGSVQFLIRVGGDDLLVAVLREPGEPIGWSAFRAPYRSMSTVRCEGACQLVRIPAAVFDELLRGDPALAHVILQRVAVSLARRLEHARDLLHAPPR